MSDRAIRCRVTGRVQGVFFRAATAEQARRLGVRGWAENLPDGSVDVVAAGDPQALAELTEWLWSGPPAAEVSGVRVEDWREPVGEGFSTG